MSKILGFLHRLEWENRYGRPPDGVRILIEVFSPIGQEGCRQIPKEIEDVMVPGLGYQYIFRAITTEYSMETKTNRVDQLTKRMREKYPLFSDQFIQEELKRKREFYYFETLMEEKRKKIINDLRAMKLRQQASALMT